MAMVSTSLMSLTSVQINAIVSTSLMSLKSVHVNDNVEYIIDVTNKCTNKWQS
jgi:hypothetical protein